MTSVQIDIDRLLDRIEQLALTGKTKAPGVTRVTLTLEDEAGRDLVVGWMRQSGLEIKIDQVGNVFGIRQGKTDKNPVMIGSHLDTVKQAGMYDGTLGVLAGLEIVETLNSNNIETSHPIIIAFFTNEEGIRFQPDMMGSLVYAGGLSVDEAHKSIAMDDSTTLLENLKSIGYLGDQSPGFIKPKAFIELHVEQGPVLEHEKIEIGVVEGVQGIYWTEFVIQGVQNHAGTTPMHMRKDAGLVAAEIIKAVRDIVNQVGDTQIGTVGSVEIRPNVINVMADYAKVITDLRNIDETKLDETQALVNKFAAQIAESENVDLKIKELVRFPPVKFDPGIVNVISQNAKELKMSTKQMWSGAGHDAQMISKIAPTAMIFIPSKGGISHNPNEHSKPEDIKKGANLLLQVVLELTQIILG